MTGALIGSALIGAGGSYLGGKKAADGSKEAAKIQAAEAQRAQEASQAYQEKMLGEAQGYLSPYTDQFGGQNKLDQFENYATTGMGGEVLGQMNELAAQGINMDYESNPAYQWRQAQQQEEINRQLASRGLYGSSEGLGILGDANMALSGEEADKQYLRGVDDYNRQYGNLTNQYNYGYGSLLDQVNMGYNANSALAGMATGVGANVGNQIMQGGLSSAGNTAQLYAQAGQQEGAG